MGRPQSATLRVCDIVGLDTVAHVAETSYERLPDGSVAVAFCFASVLSANARGEFARGQGQRRVLPQGREPASRPSTWRPSPTNPCKRWIWVHFRIGVERAFPSSPPPCALWDDPGPWGQFGRAHLTAVLAYAAEHAADIAGDIVQIDQAMRWGFNWALGPFELWDLFGVEEIVSSLEANQRRVPDLAAQLVAAGETHFYKDQGVFSPTRLRRESWQQPADDWDKLAAERAIWSNDGAYLVELDEGLGALVFSGKMNALGPAALEAVHLRGGYSSLLPAWCSPVLAPCSRSVQT